MRTGSAWVLVGVLAAGLLESKVVDAKVKFSAPPASPSPPKTIAKVTVQMTAATLGDDCGDSAPPVSTQPEKKTKSRSRDNSAKEDRACDPSSMQLSIITPAGGAATKLTVKKIELFDDAGARIGGLTPSSPTVWSKDGMYKAWDEKTVPGQELSVSYLLSRPAWGSVAKRRNRTYVLKAVVTVGGEHQTLQRDVHIAAPTSLPPGVKT